jgi:hypothetical protein
MTDLLVRDVPEDLLTIRFTTRRIWRWLRLWAYRWSQRIED